MNHTAYRHLSMPCPVMRGSLRFILEETEEFEVGRARWGRCGGVLGGAERTASATCSGCTLRRSNSSESWATMLTITPTSSSSRASATGWRVGMGQEQEDVLS